MHWLLDRISLVILAVSFFCCYATPGIEGWEAELPQPQNSSMSGISQLCHDENHTDYVVLRSTSVSNIKWRGVPLAVVCDDLLAEAGSKIPILRASRSAISGTCTRLGCTVKLLPRNQGHVSGITKFEFLPLSTLTGPAEAKEEAKWCL